MEINRPLSPCVQSAVRHFSSQEITAWELAKYLFSIHPEYLSDDIQALYPNIDANYAGEKRLLSEWLKLISERYPREDLLHTGLVILGLFYVDPSLNKLVAHDVISKIENRITFA